MLDKDYVFEVLYHASEATGRNNKQTIIITANTVDSAWSDILYAMLEQHAEQLRGIEWVYTFEHKGDKEEK